MTAWKSGLSGLREMTQESDRREAQRDQKRVPFFTPQEGKTEFLFLNDIKPHDHFGMIAFFKQYMIQDGGKKKFYALQQGDEIHPYADPQNGGRPKTTGITYIFNLTAYRHMNGIKQTKEGKGYIDAMGQYGEGFDGIQQWKFGTMVLKDLNALVSEMAAESDDPDDVSICENVFVLKRRGQGLDTKYMLDKGPGIETLDSSIVSGLEDAMSGLQPVEEVLESLRYKKDDDEISFDPAQFGGEKEESGGLFNFGSGR